MKKQNVIHIISAEQICETSHKNSRIVIDTYHNNIFHTDIGRKLQLLSPLHVYVISPFIIRKCLGRTPVTFINRKESVSELSRVIGSCQKTKPTLRFVFSNKQHHILTLIMQEVSGDDVANNLNIRKKTYYSHKYNIMLALKLRKMCDFVNHQYSKYFI